jgi:hypothetical protein
MAKPLAPRIVRPMPAGTGFAPVLGVFPPDVSVGLCVGIAGSGVAVGGGATVAVAEGASVAVCSELAGALVAVSSEVDGAADCAASVPAGEAADDGDGTAVGVARFFPDWRWLISYKAITTTAREATSASQVTTRFNRCLPIPRGYDGDIVGGRHDGARQPSGRRESNPRHQGGNLELYH